MEAIRQTLELLDAQSPEEVERALRRAKTALQSAAISKLDEIQATANDEMRRLIEENRDRVMDEARSFMGPRRPIRDQPQA